MANSSYRTHDGYSTLAASSAPGSVPSVADNDHMFLSLPEGDLQTFPPSDARSKLLGSYPQSHESDDPAGSKTPESGGGEGAMPRILKVSTYQPYFNIDTSDVLERILRSFFLNQGDFLSTTGQNPDLYGPFWICSTLVFVASALGNYANYLSHHGSWSFDINKVNWAAGVFYGYTGLLPLVLYFFFNYIGTPLPLVKLWCLYGYSLFIFIPASVLSLIPFDLVKWLILGISGFVSASFVSVNLKSHLGTSEWTFMVVVGALVLQACLALTLKFVFFP